MTDKLAPLGDTECSPLKQPVRGVPLNAPPADDGAPLSRGFLFVIVLFLHMGAGVLFFVLQKKWNLIDCVYFTVLTLTTIGYGDMAPETTTEKIFTTCYVLVGFCLLGYALGQVALLVSRREEAMFRQEVRSARNGNGLHAGITHSAFGRAALAAHGMIFFLAIGTLFYMLAEGWSSVDALYFSAVSLTTVGYGDLQIQNWYSRLFSIFYLLSGTLMTAFFLGSIAELCVNHRGAMLNMLYDHETNQRVWHNSLKAGKDVTEGDYMEYMLVQSGQVDAETMTEIKHRYNQLHRCGIVGRYQSSYLHDDFKK